MKNSRSVGASILKRFEFSKESGCWNWIGVISPKGYGTFHKVVNGIHKNLYAHRISYEYFRKKIPKGLTIDHLCRNRRCINPDHLEPLTIGENVLRGNTVSGINSRKTHCKHGHPLSGENLGIEKNGSRVCYTCANFRASGYYYNKIFGKKK